MITKVLMVCLGNICRSPLAEGILKSKVSADSIHVDSAGTGNYHIGKKPDPRSIAVANKYGINITNQRCRQFKATDFSEFDVIYVMDKSNYKNVIALAKSSNEKNKVKLLLTETDLDTQEVPDPYYDEQGGFETVFHMINKACDVIATKLITN